MTTTKKSPETSPFYSFCRSGDHHFQNLYTCKPFHRHPRPIYWRSWTQNVSLALYGFTAGQSASHTLPTNQLQRPPISCLSLLQSSTFARLSMLWSPAISCSTCSKAPIFHFAVTQTYHNLGQGPSPSTLMLAWKFWIKIMFWKNNLCDSYSICWVCVNADQSVLMHNVVCVYVCVCVCVCVCVWGGGCLFCRKKGSHG